MNIEELRKYITSSTKWFDSTVDYVDWTLISIALKQQTLTNCVWLIKFIHGWLGTRKNLKRRNEYTTDKWPVCALCTNTQCHILLCKHSNIHTNYKLQLIQAKCICHHHMSYLDYEIFSLRTYPNLSNTAHNQPPMYPSWSDVDLISISTSVSEQGYIGCPNTIKGFLSPIWDELQS